MIFIPWDLCQEYDEFIPWDLCQEYDDLHPVLPMQGRSMVIFILTYLFLLRIFLADVHCTVHTVYRNSQSSISFSKEPTAHSILAIF